VVLNSFAFKADYVPYDANLDSRKYRGFSTAVPRICTDARTRAQPARA